MIYVFPPELGLFLFAAFVIYLLFAGVKKFGETNNYDDSDIEPLRLWRSKNKAGTVWVEDAYHDKTDGSYSCNIYSKSGKSEHIVRYDLQEFFEVIFERFKTMD